MTKDFLSKLKDAKYRYFILLAAVVVTVPINMNLSAFTISLFALNALLSIKRENLDLDKRSTTLYALYALFFALSLLSLFYSENMAAGSVKIQTKLSFVVMPMALIIGLKTLNAVDIRKLFRAYIISILACTVLCYLEGLIQAIITLNPRELGDSYLSNPLMHRAYLSIFLGIGIFFWWDDKEFLPKMRLKGIAFFAITIVLLQGRINILAMLLASGGLISISFFKSFKLKQKLILVGAVVSMAIAFVMIPPEYNRFNEPITLEYDYSAKSTKEFTGLTIRLAIWNCAMPVIKDNLWQGVGIGDSKAKLLDQYSKNNFIKAESHQYNCHNQYIETTLASGIPALLSLLSIALIYLLRSWKSGNLFLGAITVFFFASMLTESVLERYWGISVLTVLMPLYYKLTQLENSK